MATATKEETTKIGSSRNDNDNDTSPIITNKDYDNCASTENTNDDNSSLNICSLADLNIDVSKDIRVHLSKQYNKNAQDGGDDDGDTTVMQEILQAMKRPPANTICRVNLLKASSRKEVALELKKSSLLHQDGIDVSEHDIFHDVLVISRSSKPENDIPKSSSMPPLYYSSIPLQTDANKNDMQDTRTTNSESSSQTVQEFMATACPKRRQKGWPMTHRVVVCDRYCAESVLRGADIFVKGILCADKGIRPEEVVAVYAEIPALDKTKKKKSTTATTRGMVVDKYHPQHGRVVFLGLGKTACSRQDMFRLDHGVAIQMLLDAKSRVGPGLPPLSGILTDQIYLQNLPSVLVGHVLNPQPHDTILDMCCAPGGKTAHLASLVHNQATIVACDKSRKKMQTAKTFFERMGATCITPLALDSTKSLLSTTDPLSTRSIQQIIQEAPIQDNGLKDIAGFLPESFDRILLDPPCSALGLRPKLFVPQQTWHQLSKHADYQQKFIQPAIQLLKEGGYMTYSTCTINALENEVMVAFILAQKGEDGKSMLELMDITAASNNDKLSGLGQPGLPGHGLNEEEQTKVRRFDPHNAEADTMGFFLALFRKRKKETNNATKRKRDD